MLRAATGPLGVKCGARHAPTIRRAPESTVPGTVPDLPGDGDAPPSPIPIGGDRALEARRTILQWARPLGLLYGSVQRRSWLLRGYGRSCGYCKICKSKRTFV